MTGPTPRLSICLLGPPEISVAGTPLPLTHLKAQALLYFLAATGQPHTREYLAALLWSEAAPQEAYHSLRTNLYRLRQALRSVQSDDVLAIEGETLGLRAAGYTCDVIEFQRLYSAGDAPALAQAAALYRGSLLQGFNLSGAPAFEDWLRAEDARLSQACLAVLEQLGSGAESREDWAAAEEYARRVALLDPFSEKAQQTLIRLHLRQGEIGPALRQYRSFENTLRQELDLSPAPETQALLKDALRRQRVRPVSSRPSERQAHPLPFIGRDHLFQQMSAVSQAVRAGQGATLLLEGEGGIGKSRLIEEFAGRLVASPHPWIWLQGACTPFDDLLAHGPFLEALQNSALGDLIGLPGGVDEGSATTGEQFSWRMLQAIRSLSQSFPLLLVIEDLQWANSSTLNLFGLVSMRIRRLPVLLTGSVQRAQAIPGLQRLISLGRSRGELHLLPLVPLAQPSVAELLRQSGLTPSAVQTLAPWLHDRSAGSPFLLNEILAQLRAEAILQRQENGWQLDTLSWLRWRSTFSLPETTHDLVAWRLANLPPPALSMLDLLAVAGKPLPVSVIQDALGIDAETLLPLVDDLSARGLVVEPPGSLLALPHHLLRETLLHRLSNLRRRSIYRQLAQTLEAHTPEETAISTRQIAQYAVAGEDISRARRFGLRVLDDLPQEYSGAETLDFVTHLYDLLSPTAAPGEMARLTHALGALQQSVGQLASAAGWHRQSLLWAQKAGDPLAQAGATFEMSELALMSNDYQSASQSAHQGLAGLAALDPLRDLPAQLLQSLIAKGNRLLGAAYAMEGSDLAAAERHLEQASRAHRQSGDQADLCSDLFELGNVSAQRGDLRRALDFYAEAASAAEAGRIHYYQALANNNYAYHSLLLGQVTAAQSSAAAGLKIAETFDLLAALLHLYSTQGEIELYLGKWPDAQVSFQRGLTLAEDLGSLERQAGYRGGLALAARGQGDLPGGARLLEEALNLIAGQGYWHLRTRLQLWLAEIRIALGAVPAAGSLLDEAIATARDQGRTLLIVQGERLRAQLHAAQGDWPAASALFAAALEHARGLDLPLETARVRAAWGEAMLAHSAHPAEARQLLVEAAAVMQSHGALADLASLPSS